MRDILKIAVHGLCVVLVAPLSVLVLLTRGIDGRDKVFQFASQTMSLFPGLPGEYLRRAFYWTVLECSDFGPSVGFGTIFAQRATSIGARVYIGAFCNIGSSRIGNDVLIGSGVSVASARMHNFDRTDVPISQQGGEAAQVEIGDGCWLGNGAVVLDRVGRDTIVAAGAVVVKPCEELAIYGGNPARLIRSRGVVSGTDSDG